MISDRVEDCIEQLPPLSPAALKALDLLNRSNVDLDAVVAVLETGPTLAARVLRLANSPFYGCTARVGTVHKACLVLGTRTLRQVITAAAVMATIEHHGQDEANQHWHHATATARTARLLAIDRHPDPDLVATAALLHDFGRILLGVCAADDYAKVMDRVRTENIPLREAEFDAFGLDHAGVGARVTAKWRLPEPLIDAIARHHTPDDGAANAIVDLVHVADVLARAFDRSDEGNIVPTLDEAAWNRLGMQFDIVDKLAPEIARETI